MKEHSKKKLARSSLLWLVMWKKWEMKNWLREQMPRKWKGNGGEED